MTKKSGNSPKPPKDANVKKRSRKSKAAAVSRTTLKKKTAAHEISDDLQKPHIEENLGQEFENDSLDKYDDDDDSFIESGSIEEFARQDDRYAAINFGIKYERIDIISSQFADIYFNGFKWAIAGNILLVPLGWLIGNRHPVSAMAFPILGILWTLGRIIFGSIRKDGSQVISGFGWMAGLLSIIVTIATISIGLIYLFGSVIMGLLIFLVGTIIVGLLVNAPVEISIKLNQRRARQINEHVNAWGEDICQAIINQEIQPDMTKEMVILSWGEPTLIENREATKNYFAEKWVYKSSRKPMYVWFVNGVVNKINDTGV